jgi:hypothetical protein
MTTPVPQRRIPRRASALAIALVVGSATLAACSGEDPTLASDPVTIPTTSAAPTTTAGPTTTGATTVPGPSDTSDIALPPPPPDTGDIPTLPPPPDTADLPVLLSVTVGVDSGAERIDTVPLNSLITLTVINPNEDDEFHLHGYELGDGQVVPAGQPAVFTFRASLAGDFELESHETGTLLMVLRVA